MKSQSDRSILSTIANRLGHELNRVVNELSLEQDILLDFQSKLDAAEYVYLSKQSLLSL